MTVNTPELSLDLARARQRIRILENLATVDEKTALMNRRGFEQILSRELGRCTRGFDDGGLVILIDIDNFKTINDLYGAQAGDAALRLVAKTLTQDSRPMDACARLSGDEFALLLAHTNKETALTRTQNIIKRLNALSLIWYGAEIPLRASLALRSYTKHDTPESLLSFGNNDHKSIPYGPFRNDPMVDIVHA